MGMSGPAHDRMVRINRALVLTLWAAVMAERLGYDRDAALTVGRAIAGTSALMKGRALGIYGSFEKSPQSCCPSAA